MAAAQPMSIGLPSRVVPLNFTCVAFSSSFFSSAKTEGAGGIEVDRVGTGGRIRGTVTDVSGGAVVGANVMIANEATGGRAYDSVGSRASTARFHRDRVPAHLGWRIG